MGLIAELKTVDIFYKTYISGSYSSTDRFGTLKELRQYFEENKRKGEVVGYVIIKNRTPGFNDSILTGKLSIEWTDKFGITRKEFSDVRYMVEFLQDHPLLAEAVGYAPASKGPVKVK
jgi:hypothetical protein